MKGTTDHPYVESWSDSLRGEVAIDAGAYLGAYALALAARFKSVLAFEPNPDIRARLEKAAQGIPNIVVRPEALWSAPGLGVLYEHGPNGTGGLGTDSLFRRHPVNDHVSEAGGLDVKLISVDLLRLPGRLDFLKIDTEGAELYVLEGALLSIERDRPKLQIELHRDEDLEVVSQWLRDARYTVEYVRKEKNQGWVLGYP